MQNARIEPPDGGRGKHMSGLFLMRQRFFHYWQLPCILLSDGVADGNAMRVVIFGKT